MAPSLTLQHSELENRLPDCVYMEIEAVQVQSPSQKKPVVDRLYERQQVIREQLDLFLTLRFDEKWIELPFGRFKVSLRGGELKVKLLNGKIPFQSYQLMGSLELPLKIKRQYLGDDKGESVEFFRSDLEIKPFEQEARTRAKVGTEKLTGRTDEIVFNIGQVRVKGSEESPVWVFEAGMGTPSLKGMLSHAKLGTLDVMEKPCRIQVTFEASSRDIVLVVSEGGFDKNVSRNKLAVIERAIISRYLKPQLEPFLSRVELVYG